MVTFCWNVFCALWLVGKKIKIGHVYWEHHVMFRLVASWPWPETHLSIRYYYNQSQAWLAPVISLAESSFHCGTNGVLVKLELAHGWNTLTRQLRQYNMPRKLRCLQWRFLQPSAWKEWESKDRVFDKPLDHCQKLRSRTAAGCGWNRRTATGLQEDCQSVRVEKAEEGACSMTPNETFTPPPSHSRYQLRCMLVGDFKTVSYYFPPVAIMLLGSCQDVAGDY